MPLHAVAQPMTCGWERRENDGKEHNSKKMGQYLFEISGSQFAEGGFVG